MGRAELPRRQDATRGPDQGPLVILQTPNQVADALAAAAGKGADQLSTLQRAAAIGVYQVFGEMRGTLPRQPEFVMSKYGKLPKKFVVHPFLAEGTEPAEGQGTKHDAGNETITVSYHPNRSVVMVGTQVRAQGGRVADRFTPVSITNLVASVRDGEAAFQEAKRALVTSIQNVARTSVRS